MRQRTIMWSAAASRRFGCGCLGARTRAQALASEKRRQAVVLQGAIVAAVLLLLASNAFAANVRWDNPGRLVARQRTALDLVFEGAKPNGRVTVPHVDGLTILGNPGQGSNVSIVNGHTRSSFTLSYPVRAEREGEIEIPSFRVATDQGVESVPAMSISVGKAAMPSAAGGKAQAAVTAQIVASDRQPYAGEVFDVDVLVALNGARRGELVGKPTWEKQDVVVEPWQDAEQIRGTGSVRLSTRAMVPQPGKTTLAPIHQEMKVDAGRPQADPFEALRSGRLGSFDSFFDSDSLIDSFLGHANMTSVTVSTDPVALDVQPLPAAPSGFTGAVGQFTLESKIVPEHPKAGEPVTWTLTLGGTGNWPTGVALPARKIPNDFRTLQPKQKRSFDENQTFTGSVSEDLVVVPTKPGTYTLAPVRFTYFDPATKSYQTAVVEPPSLQIGGAPISAPASAAVTNRGQSSLGDRTEPQQSAAVRSDPLPLSPPAEKGAVPLPRDPLSGSAASPTPLGAERLAAIVAAPLVLLLGYWLFLAARQARLSDPRRRRREALRELRAAIDRARRAGTADERRDALLAWQHAAAVVLELNIAAPTSAHVREQRVGPTEWTALWNESDGVLYGRDRDFDPTWCERAKLAVARVRRPRHNPLRTFLPSNLMPKAAAAMLGFAVMFGAMRVQADDQVTALDPISDHIDGGAAYAQGDFTTARDAWQGEVDANPSNWVARYNLGLVEGQLGAPGRALGETAAAFVRQPSNESVRWNLNAFLARVPAADRLLHAFATGAGASGFARLTSPAMWQLLLVVGVTLFSFGSALALRRRYASAVPEGGGLLASALLTAGAITGLAAIVSLHTYGPLAEPGAALVAEQTVLRSVPTDAQEAQQHRPLTPGAVVVTGKPFLGWTKVTLATGESGWTRTTELVPLYGAADHETNAEA